MGINDEQVDDAYQKDLPMIEPRSLNPKSRNLELWKVEKLPPIRKQVDLAKVPILHFRNLRSTDFDDGLKSRKRFNDET
jgi:hypothetical protein